MGYILYYSAYCIQCQRLLRILSCSPPQIKNQIHFVCIDARRRDPNSGKTIVYLESGAQTVLPPNIQRVPAIIIIGKGNRVVLGADDIIHLFSGGGGTGPPDARNNDMPPLHGGAGAGGGAGGGGATNDGFFTPASEAALAAVNQNAAPGDLVCHEFGSLASFSTVRGGVQSDQFSFLAAAMDAETSTTPAEDYSRTKLGNDVTIEKLVAQRNADIPPPPVNMPAFLPQLPNPI